MLVPDSQTVLELVYDLAVFKAPIQHVNSSPVMGVCSDIEAKLTRATGMYVTRDHKLPAWPLVCTLHDPNYRGVGVEVRGIEMGPRMCSELVHIGFAEGKP
jgi:hypothetical protein